MEVGLVKSWLIIMSISNRPDISLPHHAEKWQPGESDNVNLRDGTGHSWMWDVGMLMCNICLFMFIDKVLQAGCPPKTQDVFKSCVFQKAGFNQGDSTKALT